VLTRGRLGKGDKSTADEADEYRSSAIAVVADSDAPRSRRRATASRGSSARMSVLDQSEDKSETRLDAKALSLPVDPADERSTNTLISLLGLGAGRLGRGGSGLPLNDIAVALAELDARSNRIVCCWSAVFGDNGLSSACDCCCCCTSSSANGC